MFIRIYTYIPSTWLIEMFVEYLMKGTVSGVERRITRKLARVILKIFFFYLMKNTSWLFMVEREIIYYAESLGNNF